MPEPMIEVELEAMAHGGSALGRVEGQMVLLPYAIPGERVRARVVGQKGRMLFAEGVQLLEASADRVQPACPHFGPGRCAGCQWQHIDYPAQLLLKQDVLADQLERIGGFTEADVRPVIPAPALWFYNDWMRLLPAADGTVGFADTRGAVLPISECHVLHPDLLALLPLLDMEALTGVERLTLQRGSDGQRMLILEVANDEAPELETDLPMSVNLVLQSGEPRNLIGDLYSHYAVKGRTFRVSAGSYFRPNTSQVEPLLDNVLAALALTAESAVLEAYGGMGLFTPFLAERARLVTLIEDDPFALADAEVNLGEADNVDVIEGDAQDVLPELEAGYDVALFDLPESGLPTEMTDALAATAIPRLVILSSDPATLARDGKRLAGHGYRLVYAQPIDLAPQTAQIDTIAVFER